jgi:Domain of unknown function (DUF4384)
MRVRDDFILAAVLALVPLALSAQQSAGARDTFWSASDLITVTPNPAAHNRTRAHSSSTAPKPKTAPGDISPTGGSVSGPQASRENQVAELVSMNGYGAAPHLVRSTESSLGLRCSVLLRGADNEYAEVTPGTVFHSGDHIRLSFLANQPGYFYVIQQGSSGTWSPIYPPRNASAESTRIEAGKLQIVPAGAHSFQFDQQQGVEKLYVILSRTPIDDIDRAIRNLSNGGSTLSPGAGDNSAPLEAANVIPDVFVQKLASRDLTLVDEEKVDASSTATHDSEKAIYVVNKSTDPQASSQVVLSLELRHE